MQRYRDTLQCSTLTGYGGTMRDILNTVAREIGRIVDAKKTLVGTRTEILMELRRSGALGELDRGVKNERRCNAELNMKRFALLDEGLKRAIRDKTVLFTECGDGRISLGAPHHAPVVERRSTAAASTTPATYMLRSAHLRKLRAWGEPIPS